LCGILFHAHAVRPASAASYAAALGHMRQRGPDRQGLEHGDGFVIGHTRLSIIDLSEAANQPFRDRNGRYRLSYNGEIYNHARLRRELAADGIAFETQSDTEVLLAALLTWGIEATLTRVRGMFAFVLHDTLTRETIAARDHFGQKPLYYSTGTDGLVIASDPLAVTEITGVRAPDLDSYALYLSTAGETGTRGMHHPGRSFFAGVSMLPAGHLLRYGPGDLRIQRYFAPWELFDPDRFRENLSRNEDDLCDELLALVDQSVRRHLVSDVPVGVLLSGGIDSSALFWQAVARDPTIQTFTKLSPGIETIPLDVIPKLLQRRSATAHFITQEKRAFVAELEQFVIDSRAPSRWNSGPSMLSLCRSARRNGVIALLGGDCADEIFGGYIHYRDYFARRPALDDLGDLVGLVPGDGSSGIVSSYLAEQHDVRRAILARLSPIEDERERQAQATLLHDTATFLQTCVLPHSDAYSMAASVELRTPMLDLDLVAFAVNLPMRHKAAMHGNGEFGKRLFRSLATREVGDFINVRKEGTRNYAMAMAEPQFWNLDRFEAPGQAGAWKNPSKRQLVRMINLEMFHNAWFAVRRRPLDELMTPAGLDVFDATGDVRVAPAASHAMQ
jgi:asparagine synthase (glutamine-hydrolysing)